MLCEFLEHTSVSSTDFIGLSMDLQEQEKNISFYLNGKLIGEEHWKIDKPLIILGCLLPENTISLVKIGDIVP